MFKVNPILSVLLLKVNPIQQLIGTQVKLHTRKSRKQGIFLYSPVKEIPCYCSAFFTKKGIPQSSGNLKSVFAVKTM